MNEPGPSETARLVAGYRMRLDRVEVPYGDARGADALERDVAADTQIDPESRMARYLGARTRFFDRAVVNAIDRGVRQIVNVGAGYDTRALRYGHGEVRWFELDRAATQDDKRTRLTRLGIDSTRVTFVAVDLADPGLAEALKTAGLDPDAPALIYIEGVLVYLPDPVAHRLLHELRRIAMPGTRLAVSLRVARHSPTTHAFQQAVAARGEPAVGTLDAQTFPAVLEPARWAPVPLTSDRATTAGFAVARPVFTPPVTPTDDRSLGVVARHLDDTTGWRGSPEELAECVAAATGVDVEHTCELDVGVHTLSLAGGERWIARVFPTVRTIEQVRGDADLLRALHDAGFPAEQLAPVPDPVLEFAGQGVLLTRQARGRTRPATAEDLRSAGRLLGELHGLQLDVHRPGGGWHHVVPDGTANDEAETAATLLRAARRRVALGERAEHRALLEALDAVRICDELPLALVHPDFVFRNILQDPEDDGPDPTRPGVTVVDWTGAGIGPRVVALGVFLWGAAWTGPRGVTAALDGYLESCRIEPAELEALPAALDLRPLALAAWSFATGRTRLIAAAADWRAHHDRNARAVEIVQRRLTNG